MEVKKGIESDKKQLETQLKREAAISDYLLLWLDCDREGENIAFEVVDVCRAVNPNLRVLRARFSAITQTDCFNAMNNLVEPNKHMSDAVDVRQIIDLKSGAAFTRYQTVL